MKPGEGEPPPVADFDDDLLAVWYIQISPTSDWLGSVKRLPGSRFQMMCRFRYYRDDKVFDSADDKSIYRVVSKKPDSLERFKSLTYEMRARTSGKMFELLREGRTTEEMLAIFESWPVVHKRRQED